jgi:hypothetical protein
MEIERTIVIDFPTNTDGELTHQVRSFGEHLWHHIELEKLGDVGSLTAVDCATDRLVVRVIHAKKVHTVRKLVAELLKSHFLDTRSQVTYE